MQTLSGDYAYHKMVEEIEDYAILLLDTNGIVMNWNLGAEKIKGYKADEIIGKNFNLFYTNEDRESGLPEKLLKKAILNGKANEEGWRVRKDRTFFWGNILITAIHDENKEVIGFSKVTRDLTERKKAEDSSKLKDAFLSILSHEIRTPLNAIMGFSNLLLKRKLQETEKEYVSNIKKAGENLLTIMNDTIDMSKIEAGTMTFHENNFNIRESFKAINELLQEKTRQKGLSLEFVCDHDVPKFLTGDQKRLEQIITHITSNAICYTEKGTVHVNARVLKNEGKTILLEFSITDTGIGIPADKLNTIFERFRQVEPHNNRKHGGLGLGLCIAKRLTELQGGTLTVDSELNVGSVFTACIPYSKILDPSLPV